VAWLLGAAANWLAFQSLQMPLGWDAALLVSAALRVGVSLSTVPAADAARVLRGATGPMWRL